jgi:Tol biopolymer transport system component
VWVVTVNGGGTRKVTSDDRNDHWPPAWSSDSRTLICSTLNEGLTQDNLMSVDLETLEVTQLTDTDEVSEAWPDWRPRRCSLACPDRRETARRVASPSQARRM